MLLNIGIDDIDSIEGGCTTYVASRIVKELVTSDVTFSDYPNLIRLNPNIPWKTRGNGAVALRILYHGKDPAELFDKLSRIVEKHASIDSNPGLVMLVGDVPDDVSHYSKLAMHTLVTKRKALVLIRRYSMNSFEMGSGLGLIGALSAIGCRLEDDYTYEVISYRSRRMWGKARNVDRSSIVEMNDKMGLDTFNNIDPETERVLITPRGPDPVLFGIRGEDPESVLKSKKMISADEPVEHMVYRSNQGTGAHLENSLRIGNLRPYSSGKIDGSVSAKPATTEGGHVMFEIMNEEGELNCAAYQPTGAFKAKCKALEIGDVVEVGGGVRKANAKFPRVLNSEFLRVLYLTPKYQWRNPKCECGRVMESAGYEKGYRCRKCGAKNRSGKKVAIEVKRTISIGLYQPPPRSQRHLTKPFSRIGKEKTWNQQHPEPGWYSFNNVNMF